MGRAVVGGGGRATIATHWQYRDAVERAGLAFVGLPPGPDDMAMDEAWAIRANAPVRGIEFVLKSMILPHFRATEARLAEVAPGHDIMVTHFLALAAPAVAESLGLPWVSCAYSPTTLFSAYDPPALGVLPFLPRLRPLGPAALRFLYRGLAWPSRNWFGELHEQRRRLGLAPLHEHPLFQYFSPHGTLALFPPEFAEPQPDWPVRTHQVGFPLFDEGGALSPALVRFLDSGPPPIVFTLGTSVSLMETSFFDVARVAVERLGRRAVFVLGPRPPRALANLGADAAIHVTKYEPYPALFARAALVVHQGGVNSTARALAADRPQVVVPFANDQLDNAQRVDRLHAGVMVSARRLSVNRLVRAIRRAEPLRAAPALIDPRGFDDRLRAALAEVLAHSAHATGARTPAHL